MGFYFCACMWSCSYSYGAPLGGPWGRRSSANIERVIGNRMSGFEQSLLWTVLILCTTSALERSNVMDIAQGWNVRRDGRRCQILGRSIGHKKYYITETQKLWESCAINLFVVTHVAIIFRPQSFSGHEQYLLGYFSFVSFSFSILYFQIEISNFLPEKILIFKSKKYMAAVACEIDETTDAVQLNGFFGKTFNFYNLFSQSATLPLYLFVCLSIYIFYLIIFQPWIFSVQGFSLNFARILGRAVDKLLHASKVLIHTGSLFFESKAWVCFHRETTRLWTKPKV